MRIKELEEKSGVPRTTIHFYLRRNLLHPARKTGRTMAYYDYSHVERLKEIEKIKQGSRIPIKLLKELVENRVGTASVISDPVDASKPVKTNKEKDKKRQKIIDMAIRVFSQKGYYQTRITDITRLLKISTGTFYLYYQNKRELFIEVIDSVFRNMIGEVAIAINGETDFIERLKIRGRFFYKNYTKHRDIINQLRAEQTSEEQWPFEKIQKIYRGLTQPVIREIEEAVKEGAIREVDADLLAYTLTGLIEIMSFRLSQDGKYNLEDIMKFIEDLTSYPMKGQLEKQPGTTSGA